MMKYYDPEATGEGMGLFCFYFHIYVRHQMKSRDEFKTETDVESTFL